MNHHRTRFLFAPALVVLAAVLALLSPACTGDQCKTIAQSGTPGALIVVGGQMLLGLAGKDPCSGMQPSAAPPGSTVSAFEGLSVTFKGQPAATLQAPGGVCAAAAGDASCAACTKAHCCQEAVGCVLEAGCACLVGCQAVGGALEACSTAHQCAEGPGATYDTLGACVADHCSAECASLRLQ